MPGVTLRTQTAQRSFGPKERQEAPDLRASYLVRLRHENSASKSSEKYWCTVTDLKSSTDWNNHLESLLLIAKKILPIWMKSTMRIRRTRRLSSCNQHLLLSTHLNGKDLMCLYAHVWKTTLWVSLGLWKIIAAPSIPKYLQWALQTDSRTLKNK